MPIKKLDFEIKSAVRTRIHGHMRLWFQLTENNEIRIDNKGNFLKGSHFQTRQVYRLERDKVS